MVDPLVFAGVAQVVQRLWRSLERFDYDDVLGLLDEGVRWRRGETWYTGHREVRDVLALRPPTLVVRHLVSGLRVDADGDALRARYTLGAVNSGGAPEQAAPYSTLQLRLVGDANDLIVRRGDALLFREIDADVTFLAKP